MKSVSRIGLSVLLFGAVGCLAVACGGDDTGAPAAGGSSGAGGKGGSAGAAGSIQNGGSAGSVQNGGSAGTAGSGGNAGTAGSAGSAGNAGTGGTAGANVDAGKDATTEAASDSSTSDGAKEGSSDAPASDASSDVSSPTDAVASDAGSSDAGACPATKPADASTCTQNNLKCDYGGDTDAGFDGCVCRVVSASVTQWSCTLPDGGTAPECPKGNSPGSGTACSDSGASLKCRFGTTWCFCNAGGDAAPNVWDCI